MYGLCLGDLFFAFAQTLYFFTLSKVPVSMIFNSQINAVFLSTVISFKIVEQHNLGAIIYISLRRNELKN